MDNNLETTGQELTIIDNSMEVIKNGSKILITNKTRVAKALVVGEDIKQQWVRAYAIEDPDIRMTALAEADERSNNFLANCSKVLTEISTNRKAVTQICDLIVSTFTSEENKISKKGDV